MVAARVHPRVMMETLGHSQISVTMNTYGHVYPEAQVEAAGLVDGLLHPHADGIEATP
jgi:hypothetical protein